MPANDEREPDDLATSVVLAGLAIADLVRDALTSAGHDELRFSQLFVFGRLVQGPATIGEIGREMGFSHQAASARVNELEDAGLVRRIPNPDDGRSRLVELTPTGLDALEVGLRARDDLLQRLGDTTTEKELRTAEKVVADLLDIAGGADAVRVRDLGFPKAP